MLPRQAVLQPQDPETIARLARLAGRVQQLGRSYGATKVVIACLGDSLRPQSTATEGAHRTSFVSMRFCINSAACSC